MAIVRIPEENRTLSDEPAIAAVSRRTRHRVRALDAERRGRRQARPPTRCSPRTPARSTS